MKYREEDWLKQKILREGFTNKEISRMFDVSQSTISKWVSNYDIRDEQEECPDCGENYSYLSQHWQAKNNCKYPNLSDYQKDVLTGLMMGDGYTFLSNKRKPQFGCNMEEDSIEYLRYLNNDIFPVIGNGISLHSTAEDSARLNRKNGFHREAEEENYSDHYRFATCTHPGLEFINDWYTHKKSNRRNKSWPFNDIELNPTILKHYYVSDGCLEKTESRSDVISFAMNEQKDNKEKVRKLFERIGLNPSFYTNGKDMTMYFSTEKTEDLIEYMGEPLPGFEYKWKLSE